VPTTGSRWADVGCFRAWLSRQVASALLRALAVNRARGAQATDVDPRVMGRILQLLR
jgi:hypothetical protein